MDSWRILRTELQREAEQIFNSSGKVVLIESDDVSDSVLTLSLQDDPRSSAQSQIDTLAKIVSSTIVCAASCCGSGEGQLPGELSSVRAACSLLSARERKGLN